MSTGGPEETNSQNEIESEHAEFKTLAIINKYNLKTQTRSLSIAISRLKLFRIFLVYRYFTKTCLMHGRGLWVTLPGASMKCKMRLSGTINLLQ